MFDELVGHVSKMTEEARMYHSADMTEFLRFMKEGHPEAVKLSTLKDEQDAQALAQAIRDAETDGAREEAVNNWKAWTFKRTAYGQAYLENGALWVKLWGDVLAQQGGGDKAVPEWLHES